MTPNEYRLTPEYQSALALILAQADVALIEAQVKLERAKANPLLGGVELCVHDVEQAEMKVNFIEQVLGISENTTTERIG